MIKWIGQHIVDLIARFRSDVYLENIADGTVANDKFLGLDANNKIVKETVTSSSGDITSVGLTADDAGTSIGSGDVNFTIAGGEGIDTSLSVTTLTVSGEDASTSNKGIASFSSDNFDVSSGAVSIKDGAQLGTIQLGHASDTTIARSAAATVTIAGDQVVTASVNKGKQIHVNLRKNDNYLFYMNTKTFWYSTAGYTYTYNTNATAADFSMTYIRQNRMASYVAPYACKVKKIIMAAYYSTTATTAALDFEWAAHKWTPGNDSNASVTATLMTMTDRDGNLTENRAHNIYWDITDNAASTLAAGDAFGFAGRCPGAVDANASRQFWYGEAVAVIELI